jgi:hypothetical protein
MGSFPSLGLSNKDGDHGAREEASVRTQGRRAEAAALVLASLVENPNEAKDSIAEAIRVHMYCDSTGVILYADAGVATLLQYPPTILIGEFIGAWLCRSADMSFAICHIVHQACIM